MKKYCEICFTCNDTKYCHLCSQPEKCSEFEKCFEYSPYIKWGTMTSFDEIMR